MHNVGLAGAIQIQLVHKWPLLVPILSQNNQVHTTQAYIFKMHLNIIHPPTTWSSYVPHAKSHIHILYFMSLAQKIRPSPRLV
jgi:TRAP-type C4-dicarboxylate transport system permease large subunit